MKEYNLEYRHPLSIIGILFLLAGIFTPLPFHIGLFIAISCWIIGNYLENEYYRKNPHLLNLKNKKGTLVKNDQIDFENINNSQVTDTIQFCVECGNKYALKESFCNECGKKSIHLMKKVNEMII